MKEELTKRVSCQEGDSMKHKKGMIITIIISICVILLVSVYWGTYKNAVSAAEKGDFTKAESRLWLTSVTRLHDLLLSDYIAAGKQFENKRFQEAEESFEKCGEYRKSRSYWMER